MNGAVRDDQFAMNASCAPSSRSPTVCRWCRKILNRSRRFTNLIKDNYPRGNKTDSLTVMS